MMQFFTRRAGARRGLSLLLAALLAGLAAGPAGAAPRPTERSKQKQAAETERNALQQKLTALKRDISKTESAKDDAADTLAESEEAISNANRSLRELAAEQGETNGRLQQLGAEHARLQGVTAQQKQQLAKLLREQYVAGNEDRIKLLLSGDNPNRINRELQLMAYVSQAQARLLESLRANLKAVENNQAEAQNAKDELEEIAQEERQQKSVLEQEKARRAGLLSQLSKKLVAQRKEAGDLERDEQRMSGLIERLNKLIEEQARAAAAEKKRQEQLAAARAAKAKADAEAKALALARAKAAKEERERLAQQNRKPGAKPSETRPVEPKPAEKPFKPDPIDADEPKVAARTPEPAPQPAARPSDIALAPAAPDGAFAALKGQMRPPVAGKLAARFGARRGDGPSWKGVFIRSSEGAEVHAVAGGRVVFANWLRGFGNLIVIDHGGQYMSVYGFNESLLKRPGDVVKTGDPIAAAGNTGGNEETGLYFELRHQGRAFDPAGWVKF
ncbi:peptidoglycan DD-metalloendopeptidase family protein [Massilia sp. erpn]|uniref:peptidoglycan DD-metalloendopeptidase family protein n=1 Tax=Massilia sp. erpn TaxID=2738142 RepID=UPI0021020E95|nr:peptidoglycan DD-metalloendopeptidase family protein [Massilia sp. erpn]